MTSTYASVEDIRDCGVPPRRQLHTFDVQMADTCDVTLTVGGSGHSSHRDRWPESCGMRPSMNRSTICGVCVLISSALPRTVLTNATRSELCVLRIALPWSFEDATRPRQRKKPSEFSGLRPSDADAWFSPCNSLPRATKTIPVRHTRSHCQATTACGRFVVEEIGRRGVTLRPRMGRLTGR